MPPFLRLPSSSSVWKYPWFTATVRDAFVVLRSSLKLWERNLTPNILWGLDFLLKVGNSVHSGLTPAFLVPHLLLPSILLNPSILLPNLLDHFSIIFCSTASSFFFSEADDLSTAIISYIPLLRPSIVELIIESSDNNGGYGPTGFSLNKCKPYIPLSISIVFKKSLTKGIFLDRWNEAHSKVILHWSETSAKYLSFPQDNHFEPKNTPANFSICDSAIRWKNYFEFAICI